MDFAGFLPKRALSVAVVVTSAVGLSGCFDLAQKVALRHDGSGTYAVEVAANGIVGEGLDKKRADINIDDDLHGVTKVTRKGDTTTQTTEIAFKDFSGLKLGDETLNLHVTGKKDDLTEVNFHRTFRVDHARRHHDDDDHMGRDVLESMFGGHTYTFAVWLPGRIEHIAPVRVGNRTVSPVVWGDKYGHTLIWKMKLTDMFLADALNFDVDFAAKGDFHDAQSQPGVHHRHRHDDDDEG
jgi:hypothetical protein